MIIANSKRRTNKGFDFQLNVPLIVDLGAIVEEGTNRIVRQLKGETALVGVVYPFGYEKRLVLIDRRRIRARSSWHVGNGCQALLQGSAHEERLRRGAVDFGRQLFVVRAGQRLLFASFHAQNATDALTEHGQFWQLQTRQPTGSLFLASPLPVAFARRQIALQLVLYVLLREDKAIKLIDVGISINCTLTESQSFTWESVVKYILR